MTATAVAPSTALAATPKPAIRRPGALVVIGIWCASLVVVRLAGVAVVHAQRGDVALGAVPFFGSWRVELSPRPLFAMAVALVCTFVLPIAAAQLSWRGALGAAAIAAVCWSASLTYIGPSSNAWHSIDADYGSHVELLHDVGARAFLRDYVDRQDDPSFPTHLRAHPPGLVVALAIADRLGVSGIGLDAALGLAGVAMATVAALAIVDDLAGRRWARSALPFVVLAPAAVWHANADVVYAGIGLAALALMIRATSANGRRATLFGVGGGLVFGCALLFSYGLALLALPAAMVAHRRGRMLVLLPSLLASAAVLALPTLWGFSWIAGLLATRRAYDSTVARFRPYPYFVFANLAVVSVALGPAIVVALTRIRDGALRHAVALGLALVVVADISGLAKAETERIWQPFFPLVLVAGAALVHQRRWLALQSASAIALAVALRSPW